MCAVGRHAACAPDPYAARRAFVPPSPVAVPANAAPQPSATVCPQQPTCFNRRAEAARRRWADPVYRAKMRAARASNALAPPVHYRPDHADNKDRGQRVDDAAHASEGDGADGVGGVDGADDQGLGDDAESRLLREDLRRAGLIEVGVVDSIVGCSAGKSAALIRYVQLNKHRSEALTLFHRDRAEWMERKLRSGEELRRAMDDNDIKRQRQLARQAAARERHARVRARKAAEKTPVVG
jgi:hypothetical protein